MKCPKLAHKILATVLLAGVSATASAQMMINGAGATFPYPIYSKWFDEYAKVDPSVRFNYQSIGSGGGQKQILAQTVDFGASDGPMSDDNLAKAPGKILHIPTVAGADVVAYNLPGNPALKLDADAIAGIFLGQIKKWNDPKITALNPGVSFPDQEIVVVHRSDGSGTTYIWTDYLSKISSEWKQKVGTNTSVNWPTGIGGKGNEGVAGQIKQTPGALGYVELIYAVQNKMPYAEVKNSAGKFVKPTLESIGWRGRQACAIESSNGLRLQWRSRSWRWCFWSDGNWHAAPRWRSRNSDFISLKHRRGTRSRNNSARFHLFTARRFLRSSR